MQRAGWLAAARIVDNAEYISPTIIIIEWLWKGHGTALLMIFNEFSVASANNFYVFPIWK